MNTRKVKKPASGLSKKTGRGPGDKPGGLVLAARGLAELRVALLDLHKALVDSERAHYEKMVGAIHSPNHFLQLLIRDPWFAWMHPLSQLIVAMDDTLDEKEPLTMAGVDALRNQTRLLLVASESGEGFSKHYFDALQRDPDVVLAHAADATDHTGWLPQKDLAFIP
jgi:hypothetical protein